MAPEPPLIVIAAGGAGSRMGGDKPAQMLGQVRLVDRVCAWARQHSDALALSVQAGHGDWGTGLPLLVDQDAGIGPIAALASALREGARLGRATVLLIGCDMPLLPADLVPRLSAALPGHQVAMPVSAGRVQPLAALWRSAPEPLERWMAGGGQSLWRYAQNAGMAEVPWEGTPPPFANINDAAALARAEAWIGTAR